MDKITKQLKKLPNYSDAIDKFICIDTVIIEPDELVIIKPTKTDTNYLYYDINNDAKNIGIKNLKISGSSWEKAELRVGEQYIETIYSDIRDVFTSTLNGISCMWMTQSFKIYLKPNIQEIDVVISYNKISYNIKDKYGDTNQGDKFQIRQCNQYIIPSNNNSAEINLYDLCCGLPIAMIAIKMPIKAKRVFMTARFGDYDYIVPFKYYKNKGLWMLDMEGNYINVIKWEAYNFTVHIIAKEKINNIIIYFDNLNIGLHLTGLYGLKYSY
jgi:hypothetical protein